MKKILTLLLSISLATTSCISYADTGYDELKYNNPAPPSKEEKAKIPSALVVDLDIVSNYVFRGISVTNNNPAIQGNIIYQFPSTGIYLDAWGSNVNFLDSQGNRAIIEIDTMAGISNSIGNHFNYDIRLERYIYPQAPAATYNELLGIAEYRFLRGTIGYSPNVFNTHNTGTYYELGVKFDIPAHYIYLEGISVEAAIGHYSLPRNAGLNSYNNYTTKINKTISQTIFSLEWTGTDGRANQAPLDSNHVLGRVTVIFS